METTSILIHGDKTDYHLFKVAIESASAGQPVWFITTEAFKYLPQGLGFPDREILKLITFIYLKDTFGLLQHLNEVHAWMTTPSIIIVNKFIDYIKSDYQIASFLMCSLLDAIKCCAKNTQTNCYLILSCENLLSCKNIIKSIVNLYIDYLIVADTCVQWTEIVKFK